MIIYQCQENPKVFSLWDELAQKLALILDVFSDGIAIYVAYRTDEISITPKSLFFPIYLMQFRKVFPN